MFFTYLRRELRRRMRQAIFIALGLALGVGLVITVTAASAGVKNAQGTVLHALYGVGTDVTVTKTPKAGSFSSDEERPPELPAAGPAAVVPPGTNPASRRLMQHGHFCSCCELSGYPGARWQRIKI